MMDGVQCETKSQGKHIEHSVITYTGWGKKKSIYIRIAIFISRDSESIHGFQKKFF